jgi:hypothetical protein
MERRNLTLTVEDLIMDTFELIRRRAEIIYDILDDKINFGIEEIDPSAINAFKASFVLREKSISKFKRAFRESGLYFDLYEVEETYDNYSDELPGPRGLMNEERNLLEEVQSNVYE